MAHIAMAQEADVVMNAPASATVIAKLAHGIADDMLTSTMLACEAPIYLAPAMNTHMFDNPVTQDNLKKLREYGYHIIEPSSGYLACGDTGRGKLPEPEELFEYFLQEAACEKDLTGKKVLITAGATQEAIDPVRYVTNHSTGKMGYALAKNAARRGAEVTLVTGPTSLEKPFFVNTIPVVTAEEMYQAVTDAFAEQDIVVMAAAVADYRPKTVADEKIKKADGGLALEMERTKDILGTISARKEKQFLCGFSMETQHLKENSKAKLEKKKLDMIVANNLKTAGAGFGTDTNVVTLITESEEKELPIMSKDEVASAIFDEILSKMQA